MLSVAHSQYVLVYNFAQAIQHDRALASQPALHKIMTTCFELFATHTMDTEAAEFLSSGYISPAQHELLRNQVHRLLAEVRPQAVPLVDAFGVPDFLLNSALGRYDGELIGAFGSVLGVSAKLMGGCTRRRRVSRARQVRSRRAAQRHALQRRHPYVVPSLPSSLSHPTPSESTVALTRLSDAQTTSTSRSSGPRTAPRADPSCDVASCGI